MDCFDGKEKWKTKCHNHKLSDKIFIFALWTKNKPLTISLKA